MGKEDFYTTGVERKQRLTNEIYLNSWSQLLEKYGGNKEAARKALYEESSGSISFEWDNEGNLVRASSIDAWCE